jgi:hypothetical protein
MNGRDLGILDGVEKGFHAGAKIVKAALAGIGLAVVVGQSRRLLLLLGGRIL